MIRQLIFIFGTCIFLSFWSYADEEPVEVYIENEVIDYETEDPQYYESDVVIEESYEEFVEEIVNVSSEIVDVSSVEVEVSSEEVEIYEEVYESQEVEVYDIPADDTFNSESDIEVTEQSDFSDSSGSQDLEVVVIDGETYIDVPVSSADGSGASGGGVAHPENLENVPRDAAGNIYIAPDPGNLQSRIDLYEDLLNTEGLSVFEGSYLDTDQLTDWDIADYFKAVVTQALFDIFGDPTEEDLEAIEDEDSEVLLADDSFFREVLNSPFLGNLRSTNRSGYKNVVVYHGYFNSEEVDLIIPYEQYKNLNIQNGILVNISNNNVTGKFLYDGEPLDPSDYDSYTYTLGNIYGSTSNVYSYGSFNYRRHYYLTNSGTGNRITSQDMYGNFSVDSVDVYYATSERVYYTLLFIILFMGVNFLWNRRH